jgi:hypothetical protein
MFDEAYKYKTRLAGEMLLEYEKYVKYKNYIK